MGRTSIAPRPVRALTVLRPSAASLPSCARQVWKPRLPEAGISGKSFARKVDGLGHQRNGFAGRAYDSGKPAAGHGPEREIVGTVGRQSCPDCRPFASSPQFRGNISAHHRWRNRMRALRRLISRAAAALRGDAPAAIALTSSSVTVSCRSARRLSFGIVVAHENHSALSPCGSPEGCRVESSDHDAHCANQSTCLTRRRCRRVPKMVTMARKAD